jgi:UDP-GlcNAc:undecaprenyl-phosphate GlcNAc-1-phosphate transferase
MIYNLYTILALFVGLLAFSILFLKKFISYLNKHKILDTPGDRKAHKAPTPSSGGVVFGIVMIILSPFIIIYTNYSLIIFLALCLMVLGYFDDRHDFSAKLKFVVQIIISLITILAIGPVTVFENNLLYINHIITFLLIVGFTNSFNLIDGIDGLAGLYALFALTVLGVLFYLQNNLEIVLIISSLIASVLAFLKFNIKSAKIFMGDTGSLFLGYMISAFCVILINNHNSNISTFLTEDYQIHLVIFSILTLPIVDTIRVMIVRISNGKSPFKADRLHLHHLLQKIGFNSLRISIAFTSISLMLTALTYTLISLNLSTFSIIISVTIVLTIKFNIILYLRIIKHQKNIKSYHNTIKYIVSKNQLLNSQ